MKKYQMKIVSTAVIMAMLAASLTGCNDSKSSDATANAVNTSDKKEEKDKTDALAKAVTDGITTTDMEAGKDETVYVVLNNDGTVSNITVNDVLKNIDAGNVSDSSELTDIKNIKGDEAYTGSSDAMVWAGTGKDITYQGNIKKDLPVSVKISYTLDGKEVTADKLAGASGHLVIKYEYTNNTETTTSVNGQDKKVLVPFVVASGMFFPSEKCSNVTIDNGRIIEEGSNVIVVGYALPGIMDCVKSQVNDEDGILDKFDVPESVTIEADVTDFEQDMSLTIALPNLLGDKSEKKLDYTEITDKMDDLNDASTKLVDGTTKLDNGVSDLKDGTSDLKDGANDLNNGANDLNKGAGKLEAGAKSLKKGTSSLKSGAKQVSDGLGTIKGKSAELKTGTNSITEGAAGLATGAVNLDTGAGQLAAGAATVDQKLGEVQTGVTSLDAGADQLKAGFEGENGAVAGAKAIAAGTAECATGVGTLIATMKQSPESIQKQIDTIMQQVKALAGIDSSEKLATMISSIDTAISGAEATTPIATVLSAASSGSITSYETYMKLVQANYSVIALEGVKKSLTDTITENAESMTKLNTGMQTLKTGTAGLSTGIDTMYAGATTLAGGTETLKTGITALKAGTATLSASAVKLKEGTAALATGANKLNAGTKTYSTGITSLIDGIDKLAVGGAKLYKGTKSLGKGAGTLYNGLVTLGNGSSALYDGTVDLKAGTTKLYKGTKDLDSGAADLKDGTTDLKDGMAKFNEEGVEKITSLLGDNLKDAADLLEAIVDQGSEYKNFAGISDGMDGEVKFIYKTEAIQKAEEE